MCSCLFAYPSRLLRNTKRPYSLLVALFLALCPILNGQTAGSSDVGNVNQTQVQTQTAAALGTDASGPGSPMKEVLELHAGERIAIFGSSVGQAMFQDTFLPDLLQSAVSEGKVTFVNHAFAGDVVSGGMEAAPALAARFLAAKAEVIFAFYGAVEASCGEDGLVPFLSDLGALVKVVRNQSAAEKRPVRLVLFGPPARERLLEWFSKEGAQVNANLKLYSEAMAGFAKKEGILFFDLYSATEKLFATGPQRSALLPKRWGAPQSALTVNGGFLTAEAHRLLAPVIFEELFGRTAPEISGLDHAPERGLAGQTRESIGAAEAVAKQQPFELAAGLSANLFASEVEFPELRQPSQMEWDSAGRLWVLCPTEKEGMGRLLIFEDSDGDARADRCTVFADGLAQASSFVLYRDGALLQQGSDLWLLRDPVGLRKATELRRVLSGLAIPGEGRLSRRMVLDPKGGVIVHDLPHAGGVETGLGVSDARGGVYRFEPATGRLEVLVDATVVADSDWRGSVLDAWGRDLFEVARGRWQPFWPEAPLGVTGAVVMESGRFPAEWQGRLVVGSSNAPAGLKMGEIRPEGAALSVRGGVDLVTAKGSDFFPLVLSFAPDGALVFGEGTGGRGRIYRVVSESHPMVEGARSSGEGIPALLERLKSPEPVARQQARNALAAQPAPEVLEALRGWELGLQKTDAGYEKQRLEVLWLRRWFDGTELGASRLLLEEILGSPEPQVRAEAVRIVRETGRMIPEAVRLLTPLAADGDPIVRREVLAAACGFKAHDPAAVAMVHTVLGLPLDDGLERMAGETLRKLEPDSSRMIIPKEARALKFVLARLSPTELAKAPGVEPVWLAQVDRAETAEAVREAAFQALSKAHGVGRAAEIARAIGRAEAEGVQGAPLAEAMGWLLLKSPASELTAATDAIEKLAERTQAPRVRAQAHAAWLLSAPDRARLWGQLAKAPQRRVELLSALPLVDDAGVRSQMRPLIVEVLENAQGTEELCVAALRALSLTGVALEVKNFDVLAAQILRGRFIPEAAQAIAQLSAKAMGGERAGELGGLGPVVSALSHWLAAVPEKERTQPQFAVTVQVARGLAVRLEAQTVAAARKLRELKPGVCVVRTVFGEGRYDTTLLSLSPGQAFELVFENIDALPQNLVLLAPGAKEEVLLAAERMSPVEEDAEGRLFVPVHPGVLAATKVLGPGERQVLSLKSPLKPGKYEYVSTIPGRPAGLRGVLEVGVR